MAEAALRSDRIGRIQGLDEGEVQAALRIHNPRVPAGELKTMALIVTEVFDFLADLPKAERNEIARERLPFRAALAEAAQSVGRTHLPATGEVEQTRGSGLGRLLSLEEGRRNLDSYATARSMEEWAGPVAGAGELEKRFGIRRSTLNTWYKQGAIVGLLRGQRKLAYPIEQFIDARPLQGLGDVLSLAPDPRSAWLWLRQPHGALDGTTPLERLGQHDRGRVIAVARRDFDRELV